MDLEKIIELAKEIARPYKITTYILAVLLVISLVANVYLATQNIEVSFDANDNIESNINQSNE